MILNKGSWVEIEDTILAAEERTANLPEDTQKTPLTMWMRGFLDTDKAQVGDEVEIITLAKRRVRGRIVESAPRHNYDYGDTILELIEVGEELKIMLENLLERGE